MGHPSVKMDQFYREGGSKSPCKWSSVVGIYSKGRILPAFPGAGGGIRDDVLEAALTPAIIQPTTFGEITGKKTKRTKALSDASDRRCAQMVPAQ